MSTLAVNSITDANAGNTATINGMTPTADSLQGFRNRIINGDMRIDQRNAGAAVTATVSSNYFAADRFRIGIGATNAFSLSIQQVADAPANSGFLYSQKYTVNTATTFAAADTFQTGQRIEYSNVYDLGWNDATTRYYVTTYTINSANTWEYKTITVASPISGGKTVTFSFWVKSSLTGNFAVLFTTQGSPTQNGIGLYAMFDLGQGSTYQTASPNTWTTSVVLSTTTSVRLLANAGATLNITGVQLEVGSVATPFERRPYGTELSLCQRYYYKVFPGATNRLLSTGGVAFSTTAGAGLTSFPVPMRTRPTALEQNGTPSHYGLWNTVGNPVAGTAGPTYNLFTTDIASNSNLTVASGLVAGSSTALVTQDASAYLAWSAEL